MLKSDGKYGRMTEICSVCGEPRDYRGRTGMCNSCSCRAIGTMFADCNRIYLRRYRGKSNLALNVLPPEIAGYIAGIIDADGTVTEYSIAITSKSKEFLTVLQSLIGGKISPQRHNWQLALRRLEQKYILPQIIPYMIYKKERASNFLNTLIEGNR